MHWWQLPWVLLYTACIGCLLMLPLPPPRRLWTSGVRLMTTGGLAATATFSLVMSLRCSRR